jgi:hypothetical protein
MLLAIIGQAEAQDAVWPLGCADGFPLLVAIKTASTYQTRTTIMDMLPGSSERSVPLVGNNTDSPDRDGLGHSLIFQDMELTRVPSWRFLGPLNSTQEAHP